MRWRYDERYFERELYVDREIELFEISRSYKELIERLKLERVNYMRYFPVVVDIDDYFDDPTVNDEHLPCNVIDIVGEYDDITYLGITNNIKGDWTKITNVDKVYEIIIRNNPIDYYGVTNDTELMGYYVNNNNVMRVSKNENCYVKVRLVYDDGG